VRGEGRDINDGGAFQNSEVSVCVCPSSVWPVWVCPQEIDSKCDLSQE
jgi:hypothetical protein